MCDKKREDPHRPSEIVPSDYDYAFSFFESRWYPSENYLREQLNIEKVRAVGPKANVYEDIFKCDVCGTLYSYGDVWLHRPTGEYITIGEQCAAKYGLLAAKPEYEHRRANDILIRKQRKRKLEGFLKARAFVRMLPEGLRLLRALRCGHNITHDMRLNLLKWGSVSDAQIELAFKVEKEHAEYVERAKARASEINIPVPDDDNRHRFFGIVESLRFKENFRFGGNWKITVRVVNEAGEVYRIWGTCPSSILGDTKSGSVVAFDAKVSKSDDDESFGFFKRPTKASVIVEAQ